ncbi:FliC/FljB family flagellin [Cupriavidus gilardii]|uniref:FliC/FljB family flagellin n=1 Tax=Cupriavidus gilardii TaxID=82541 RepID=UPI0015808AE6|nr:FliC/FljB family flagellin [Cupriavidus gilardii]MCT9070144.1 FliC/FljB family flagellin [Cupriavidus gilardii]QKS61885.1 FliC/FljB family flagellin [Cupriavidus gilardii]
MAQVINTNSLSLMTQNNLNTSQSALNTAIQRLSSGLRINSAKDDAAGQAIANRFTANIRGLTQAQRNANDGISLAQTTEGALTEVNNNLQRIRELSVQAANGSNSPSDLKSIQDEIAQRLDEIDRTSQQTDFNGVKVLASDKTLTIQVGANDSETIDIDLKQINRNSLGLGGFNVGASTTVTSFTTTAAGVTTTAKVNLAGVAGAELPDGELKLVGYGAYTAATDTYANYAVVDSAGNAYKLTAGDVNAGTGAVTNTTIFATQASMAAAKAAYDADAAAGTASTANPLAALDAALKKVDELRSSLGAVQNRFDSVIANLGTTVTNLSASRSRIQDADYATEVSNMTRAQILQQAGTSVLAQANQTTQNVLSLLR